MSQWRGRIEEIEEPGDVVELVGDYYQIPSVVLLVAFMLWVRLKEWSSFVVDGTVYFSGNDPWYHYRMVSYTVRNWPETSPFDPWTYFPFGAHSSQFGTVMDQIVATVALVVGLGSPSEHTIRMVALVAPAVFGAATAIPIYYIGRRTSNRFAGVVAVGVLALAPTAFVQRTQVGFYDHHAAEILFQTLAILATMVAVSVAEEDKPVWELFEARDVDALRRPVGWALVAGVAIATYVWTWPPGVFLLGILGFFYLIQLSSEYAHGESPEHLAIVGAISMATAGVLTLASLEAVEFSSTSFSLLQPGVAFVVAFGCVFMAWLARQWDARDLPDLQYPAAVFGILLVGAGLFSVVLPDLFAYVVDQVLRVIGLDATPTARTIAEAQPLAFENLYDKYRFTVYIALLGVGYVFARHFWDKPRAEVTLLALWLVFMLLAALTQRRFDYYLAVSVAAMTALVIGQFVDFARLFEFDGDIETYQLLTILAIVMVVFAPLVYPMAVNDPATGDAGVLSVAQTGPGQSIQAWDEDLAWMQENTPSEGNFRGANNDMPYYGTFERTDDYEYDEGFYGVLSWWDYGHWITTLGERVPNANPFQQGAEQAANFLLAGNESHANEVTDRMADGENAETRYVMVDWKMVSTESFYLTDRGAIRLGSKYGAPFQFYSDGNISSRNYYERLWYRSQSGYQPFNRHKQNYYESTAVRLYKFHGSAVEPQPVVLDWDFQSAGEANRQLRVSNGTRQFRTMEAAREFVEEDGTSQVGGFGRFPEERVPAMEHYRLVSASQRSATQSGQYLRAVQKYARGVLGERLFGQTGLNQRVMGSLHKAQPNWVKTFEKVPGATIEGTGPENTTVTAEVVMQMPNSNATFNYRQQADTDESGEFTMTVPYSTTGYDEYGPQNGHTNTSVRATGPYEISTGARLNQSGYQWEYNGTVDVTEGQVVGDEESASTVDLTRSIIREPASEPPGENETAGNETAPDGNESTTGGSETAGTGDNETTDGGASQPEENDSGDASTAEGLDERTALSLPGLGLVGAVVATRRR